MEGTLGSVPGGSDETERAQKVKARPDFSLRQIEVFCQVARLKSFSKAANAVFLSQPTVSEHMAALERTLGTRLFDRVRGSVDLTRAGHVFLDHAERLLSLQRAAVQALEDLRGAIRGQLDIAGSTIPGTYILPGLVRSFREKHADVRVTIRTGDSADVADMVESGEVELGIVGSRMKRRGMEAREIARDELVAICPPNHPWARRRSIDGADLASEPFVLREQGSGTRESMERDLAQAEIGPIVGSVEVGSTEAVKEAVKSGLGVSIVSRRAIVTELAAGALAATRVKGLELSRALYLITSSDRSQSGVCKAFLDHIESKKGDL